MDTTSEMPPYQPAPGTEPSPRSPGPRLWLAAVAGGLAGGVLTTAIVVPGALFLDSRLDAARADRQASAGEPVSPQNPALPNMPQSPFGGSMPGPGGQWPDAFGQGVGGANRNDTTASAAQSVGVVLINTTTPNGRAAGSGMVLDNDGEILTNYHVVQDSTAVTVTVASTGQSYPAEVVGYDEKADVAVLDIDAADLDTVTIDEDPVQTGDAVTAVGNAEGQGYLSAASGNVVAQDQQITAGDEMMPGNAERLSGLIETDATVVGGYSGGPILDEQGEVVGITTAASSGTALAGSSAESYGVPIDDALAVADQIESGDESGDVTIGPAAYLGIALSADGAIVQVEPGTPAAEAGLAPGDTITDIDGTSIGSASELLDAMATHEPGDDVSVTWVDGSGTQQEAQITLGESPTA